MSVLSVGPHKTEAKSKVSLLLFPAMQHIIVITKLIKQVINMFIPAYFTD